MYSLLLYTFFMAKAKTGKALSSKEIDAIAEQILSEDVRFAEGLTEVMRTFIEKKKDIRNYGELRTVQEVRSVLLGKQTLSDLLGEVDSIEVSFVTTKKKKPKQSKR